MTILARMRPPASSRTGLGERATSVYPMVFVTPQQLGIDGAYLVERGAKRLQVADELSGAFDVGIADIISARVGALLTDREILIGP